MIIDVTFIILMVLAIYKGFSRGFIVALFSLIAFMAGLAAALKLSALVASYLGENISVSKQWLPALSFFLVFVIVVLLVRLGASLLEKTFQIAMLGWVNRIAGIILYMVVYSLILSVLLFYIVKMGLIKPATLNESLFWPYLEPWGPLAMEMLGKAIPIFKGVFEQLEHFFEQLSEKVS